MPPDRKKPRGPALRTPDLANMTRADQSEQIAIRVATGSCVMACSPSWCMGCADRAVAA